MPHCAAIFWGDRLTVVHNLAWGKARGDLDGQGTVSHDTYSGEAMGTLTKVLRGRTVKVGKHRTSVCHKARANLTFGSRTLLPQELARR
jgi:hypothetical protein